MFSVTIPRCVCDPITSRGSDYVEWIGYYFSQCVYTQRDKLGFALGLINISLWMCIHIPLLYSSAKTRGKGLALGMLLLWMMADLAGVLGLVLTNQKGVLTMTLYYFLSMDTLLVGQCLWYNHIFKRDPIDKNTNGVHLVNLGNGNVNNNDGGQIDIFKSNDSRNIAPQQTAPSTYGSGGYRSGRLQSGQALLALSICVIALALTPAIEASVSYSLKSIYNIAPNHNNFDDISQHTVNLTTAAVAEIPISALNSMLDSPPQCVGGGSPQTWRRNIGITLAWIASIINCLSKVPQILYQKKRKSTYGLSLLFLTLNSFTPFTYSLSVLIPTKNYDKFNGFRAASFWIETFPYILVSFFMIISNIIIFYQIRVYKDNTERDRIQDEAEHDIFNDNSLNNGDYKLFEDTNTSIN